MIDDFMIDNKLGMVDLDIQTACIDNKLGMVDLRIQTACITQNRY